MVVMDHQHLVAEASNYLAERLITVQKVVDLTPNHSMPEIMVLVQNSLGSQRDTDKKFVHCSKAYLLHTVTLSDSQNGHSLTASVCRTI